MSGPHKPIRPVFQEVVDKLARREGFMAHVLRQAYNGDVSATRISRELGCSEDAALRLALMRAPAADRFRADVATMATDIGIEPARLIATIRQAAALAAFDTAVASGCLMAARDRPNDEEER